jgi:hypothetical protein
VWVVDEMQQKNVLNLLAGKSCLCQPSTKVDLAFE